METAAQRAEREWRERCNKIYDDMYLKRDSVTARLMTLEDDLNQVIEDMKESSVRRERKINLLLGAVFSLMAGLMAKWILKI